MKAIFAVDMCDGFGANNDMPWPRNSTDLKRFRELTTGATVVMGSGTWNSNMPKPLPNRRNIVLSKSLTDDRCEIYGSITELTMNINQDENVFVIGGAETLWKLRPFINTIYLTRFKLITKSQVVLNTTQFLEGFELKKSTDLDDQTFDIWVRK